MTPFDVVKNINSKTGIIDVTGQSMYIVMTAFSNTMDTVLLANEANKCMRTLDNEQLYRFLYHAIPKGKRYGSWNKKPKPEDEISAIMRVLNYSRRKAEEVYDLLDKSYIEKIAYEGGKKK